MRTIRFRTLVAAAALTLGVAMAVGTGTAGTVTPHTVDPSLMTPTLNPSFAPYTCFEAGTGITCKGGHDERWDAIQTGIFCDGEEVISTGFEVVGITRWHDLQGRALKTSLQTRVSETFTLPGHGSTAVVSSGAWHKHYTYPDPGVRETRVLTETGSIQRLRVVGGGQIFQDTGYVQYLPDFEYEVPTVLHGVHDRFGGPDWVDTLCTALTA